MDVSSLTIPTEAYLSALNSDPRNGQLRRCLSLSLYARKTYVYHSDPWNALNLLFVESPAGVGWSYSNVRNDYIGGDTLTIDRELYFPYLSLKTTHLPWQLEAPKEHFRPFFGQVWNANGVMLDLMRLFKIRRLLLFLWFLLLNFRSIC